MLLQKKKAAREKKKTDKLAAHNRTLKHEQAEMTDKLN